MLQYLETMPHLLFLRRPLLNGTWPELVRLALLDFCVSNPRDPASIAVDELKVISSPVNVLSTKRLE